MRINRPFTDTAAILNLLDLKSIMKCLGGMSTIRYSLSSIYTCFRANFSFSFPRNGWQWEKRSFCRVWM